MKKLHFSTFAFFLIIGLGSTIFAQPVSTLIVEIKTGDVSFAGTDDPIHFLIGGKDFNLDNSEKDDFERNNTDVFTLSINDPNFTVETIRAVGVIRIEKTEDSYFGGGWNFARIKVWINDQSTEPIYVNESINKWLDGDDRSWGTNLGEQGWNLPESPPFPPCTADDVIVGIASKTMSIIKDSDPKLDSDCDGIPDDIDTTFDTNFPDADKDGLPDKYEEQNGLNPNSNDSDLDGWLDNKNVRDILILTKVECIDEDGQFLEIGSDEIYLNVEDVRFPVSTSLDNYWELDDDTSVQPFIVIDERLSAQPDISPQYKSRIFLREADFEFIEKPTDDLIESFVLDWSRNEIKELEYNKDGAHYKLFFKSSTINFTDLHNNVDSDGDDITDAIEFKISTQSPDLRPSTVSAVAGYDGLANPFKRDLFIEVDATSSDDNMPFDAKQQVVSQFWNQNISVRLDDGFLKGGEILPFKETVEFSEIGTYRTNNQWTERHNHYRYALYVPDMGGGNGRANRPGTKLMVSRSTMIGSFSSIVFIHELGHTLDLCHPVGTSEPPFPSPSCPTPPDWDDCGHYCGVDDESVTAMGDDIGMENIVTGGAIGIMIGLAIIALFIPGIGWFAGALLVLGAALIGSITGFLFSDSYERIVDYHPNEWAVILFNVFQ